MPPRLPVASTMALLLIIGGCSSQSAIEISEPTNESAGSDAAPSALGDPQARPQLPVGGPTDFQGLSMRIEGEARAVANEAVLAVVHDEATDREHLVLQPLSGPLAPRDTQVEDATSFSTTLAYDGDFLVTRALSEQQGAVQVVEDSVLRLDSDGNVVWEWDHAESPGQSIADAQSGVVAVSTSNGVTGLDWSNGEPLWESPSGALMPIDGTFESPLFIAESKSAGSDFMALDVATGAQLWSQTFLGDGDGGEFVVGAGPEHVFTEVSHVGAANILRAYASADGTFVGELTLENDGYGLSRPLFGPDGSVTLTGKGGSSLDTWKVPFDARVWSVDAVPAEAIRRGNAIYLFLRNQIAVLDAETGRQLSYMDTPGLPDWRHLRLADAGSGVLVMGDWYDDAGYAFW